MEQLYVPPGHFASPIPCLDEIRQDEARLFDKMPAAIPGVDMHSDEQLLLLNEFVGYYHQLPFTAEKSDGLRYYYDNPAFSYCDAIILFCMIRKMKPNKIIEAGSGFSSCVSLDTNDLFFNGNIDLTFIEPYPRLLRSLLTDEDENRVRTIPCRLQDVELSEFDSLQANDILFIDSTHVSKIGSDVNYIFFEILPRLAQGVIVHFH
ncbi:MAG TPA: class I SAM-dependent methyltransferase, partial [Halioglobus sp.]